MSYITRASAGASSSLPAGTVIDFAGSTPPSGWLECDGSAVSRTTYATLFAAIGTTWGVGDGSTTFELPDLRGRTTLGAGTGDTLTARTLGATGGREAHTEVAAHGHNITDTGHTHGPTVSTGAGGTTPAGPGNGTSAGGSTGSATTGITINSTGDASVDHMNPFAVVRKLIKA